MSLTEDHNLLVSATVKSLGPKLLAHGDFASQMVALESITTGLLLLFCITHNKQPDETAEAFVNGVKKRLHELVYGKQQH